MENRKYRLRRRAERQDGTRQRIVEAIVELHRTIGPALTTVSAIAEKAGVQRLTVYRYFPDQRSQFAGCGAHWQSLHPRPDVARWLQRPDPAERRRHGLRELYAYYRETQDMTARVLRDLPLLPELGEVAQLDAYFEAVARALIAEDWTPAREAAVRLSIQFPSWQALDASGLQDGASADLMAAVIDRADEPGGRQPALTGTDGARLEGPSGQA
jgi:AcrR family transcriptional regulator